MFCPGHNYTTVRACALLFCGVPAVQGFLVLDFAHDLHDFIGAKVRSTQHSVIGVVPLAVVSLYCYRRVPDALPLEFALAYFVGG